MATYRERQQAKRAQIEKAQRELEALEEREAQRLGQLALKAGLGDITVDDDALLAAFTALAEKFQGAGPSASTPRADPPAPPVAAAPPPLPSESDHGPQTSHAA